MAYINAETAKKIRQALKDEFGKTVKFSVRIHHHSSVSVTILQSPYFEDGEHLQVNQYYINEHYEDSPEQKRVLNKVDEIIRTAGDYWDKSDIMSDFFHTAFYYDIKVGAWDKPHVKTQAAS